MIDVFQACMIKVGCVIGGWDMLTWTSFPNSTKMNLLEAFPKLIFKKIKFVKFVKGSASPVGGSAGASGSGG